MIEAQFCANMYYEDNLRLLLFLQEWLPNNRSVIRLQDFTSIKALAERIKYLDENDDAYEEYLQFKHKDNITNSKLKSVLENRAWEPDFDCMGINHGTKKGNFVDHFDCLICDTIHQQMKGGANSEQPIRLRADRTHYGCPLPEEFVDPDNLTNKAPFSAFWHSAWVSSYCDVTSLYKLSDAGKRWVAEEDMKRETRKCLMNPYVLSDIKQE